ncbi:MAG TPA: hypothetical protein VN914_15535 [Polyangia bacterium]|nr:hypothetical protein [Polyangia bacterium]
MRKSTPTGGTGGEEETGGSTGTPTGGKVGGTGTGGAPSTGGSVGTGGTVATGGSGGSATGGAGGSGGAVDAGATGGAPADAGPAGDVGLGVLPPGDKHVVVLHGTSTAGDPLRASVMSVLTAMKDSHGVIYEEMIDKQTKATQLMDKALVFVAGNSDFCESEQDMAFGDLPIPVIVSKDCDRTTRIFQLGMMHNTPNDQTKIHIVAPMHPLAAGLMGDVTVFPSNSRIVNAGNLGPEAVVIATTMPTTTPPNSPTIFFYPKGAAMLNGFKAPGKRMGFFWHRPTVGTDGAKKLLTAAVDWMLRQ